MEDPEGLSEAGGYQLSTPHDVLKQSFESAIIEDGHTWIEALEDRNLAEHTYNEEIALKIEHLIKDKYFPAIAALHAALNKKTQE